MPMKMLGRWLLTSLTILAVPYLVSGVHVEGFGTALVAAILLGILNVTVKPVLILFTLPFTLVTLGLFLLVVNALVFQLLGALLPGLHVDSFGSAFLAALVVSAVSWLLQVTVKRENGRRIVVVQDHRQEGSRKVRDLN
jgi:putative membrane protein